MGAHANKWLYRIAHAEHHVAMDFPLGPHAAFLEKLVNYTAIFFSARVVGLPNGAVIFAINILMSQCVMEHAYTSLNMPCLHNFLGFNTADEHEAHHKITRGNYGYAFNWYDRLFCTAIDDPKGRRTIMSCVKKTKESRYGSLSKVFNAAMCLCSYS